MKSSSIPVLPIHEFEFISVRSSGPGGQNVNKVNSKVILKWNYSNSSFLTEEQKWRFKVKYKNLINNQNEVVISSDSSRDRSQNRDMCINKLETCISSIWRPPKKRIPTKVKYSARIKRVEDKKKRGSIKDNRGRYKE